MKKNINLTITSFGAAALLFAGSALPSLAQNYSYGATNVVTNVAATVAGTGITANANVNASVTLNGKITTRADQEITRRLNALNALSTRVNAMARLSASDKSALSASISSQITAMNALDAQIAADASSTSALRTDQQSITTSYRIFILVLPQGTIEAASDRVLTIVGLMNDLSAKFQTRITADQSAGVDVSAAVTALADMNAKVADANTQAQAAAAEVVPLMPDQGNTSVQASNTATLKDARAKLKVAQQDLIAARADAGTIAKVLVSVSASATTTTP